MTLIKIKDEDFDEFEILVKTNPEASEQLEEIINDSNYDTFQDIIDFINNHFEVINIDTEEYEI